VSDRLISVFAEVLGVDEASLSDDSSPDTVEKWDSLSAMRLVSAIEETFSVELSTREIMKMSSIRLAREALLRKGVTI
jgi:acyl carrier protein